MKNITILVADGHGEIREVVRDYLNRLPGVHVVGEAQDGIEVIAEVERLRPDVVFMDVGLPKLNGIEVTRVIKSRFASTKVFLATLFDESLYKREARRVSADGLVSKSHLKGSLASLMRTVQQQAYRKRVNPVNR